MTLCVYGMLAGVGGLAPYHMYKLFRRSLCHVSTRICLQTKVGVPMGDIIIFHHISVILCIIPVYSDSMLLDEDCLYHRCGVFSMAKPYTMPLDTKRKSLSFVNFKNFYI